MSTRVPSLFIPANQDHRLLYINIQINPDKDRNANMS